MSNGKGSKDRVIKRKQFRKNYDIAIPMQESECHPGKTTYILHEGELKDKSNFYHGIEILPIHGEVLSIAADMRKFQELRKK